MLLCGRWRSSGGFTTFTVKYPASQSQEDAWPNELLFDGVNQAPSAGVFEHLTSNGGSVTGRGTMWPGPPAWSDDEVGGPSGFRRPSRFASRMRSPIPSR